jgi:hypothetical protein
MTVASYWAMHRRVMALRGPATEQRCAECRAPAVLWCYDETDPDEQRNPHRYSLDPTHYRPRCRPCHRQAIAGQRHLIDAQTARLVRLYQDGTSLAAIAAQLGVGRAAVRSALRERGVVIRPPGSRPRTVVDAERAAGLYAGGASLRGIAELLDASVPAVRAAVAANGLAIRAPGPRRHHSRAATRSNVTFRPLPATSSQPGRLTPSPSRRLDQP